jgi:hypothetical protein
MGIDEARHARFREWVQEIVECPGRVEVCGGLFEFDSAGGLRSPEISGLRYANR